MLVRTTLVLFAAVAALASASAVAASDTPTTTRDFDTYETTDSDSDSATTFGNNVEPTMRQIALEEGLLENMDVSPYDPVCNDVAYIVSVYAHEHISLVAIPRKQPSSSTVSCPHMIFHDTPNGKINARLTFRTERLLTHSRYVVGVKTFAQLQLAFQSARGIDWNEFSVNEIKLCSNMVLDMFQSLNLLVNLPGLKNFVVAELSESPKFVAYVRSSSDAMTTILNGKSTVASDSVNDYQLMEQLVNYVLQASMRRGNLRKSRR